MNDQAAMRAARMLWRNERTARQAAERAERARGQLAAWMLGQAAEDTARVGCYVVRYRGGQVTAERLEVLPGEQLRLPGVNA